MFLDRNHIPRRSVILAVEFQAVYQCLENHCDQACPEIVPQLPKNTT